MVSQSRLATKGTLQTDQGEIGHELEIFFILYILANKAVSV